MYLFERPSPTRRALFFTLSAFICWFAGCGTPMAQSSTTRDQFISAWTFSTGTTTLVMCPEGTALGTQTVSGNQIEFYVRGGNRENEFEISGRVFPGDPNSNEGNLRCDEGMVWVVNEMTAIAVGGCSFSRRVGDPYTINYSYAGSVLTLIPSMKSINLTIVETTTFNYDSGEKKVCQSRKTVGSLQKNG